MDTNTTPHLTDGSRAIWHRSGNRRPRPVLVVKHLARRVRVLDLVDSTQRHLIFREVEPVNLTPDVRS